MNDKNILAFIIPKNIEDLPLAVAPNLIGNFVVEEGGEAKRLPSDILNKILNTGISGDLDKVTAAEIPTTGYYKYDIFTAKTYTNVTPNITVSPEELKDNVVFGLVLNGVAYKALQVKPSQQAKQTFDPDNNTDPSTMNAAYKASDQIFDKAVDIKAGSAGSVVLGYGTTATTTSNYASVMVNNTPAVADGNITEIAINITSGFNLQPIVFVILELVEGTTFKCVSSHNVTPTTAGAVNTIILPASISIKRGQYLGLGINERYFNTNEGVGQAFGFDGYNMFIPGNTQLRGTVRNQSWCYTYKLEKIGLTGDEAIEILLDIKQKGTGGAPAGTIDLAYEYGVSDANTAAENTSKINTAIQAAFTTKKDLIFPNGIIKHNGLNYKEGVVIRGKGINNTTLLNESGTYAIQDIDTNNSNQFLEGTLIQDMTIDGGNVADIGLNIRNYSYMSVNRVVFKHFKQYCSKMEGVITIFFNMVKFQNSKNGIYSTYSQNSSLGYMQNNMQRYTMCYFALLDELCADFVRGANIVFDQCDFESVGIQNNNETGGVRATDLCTWGEGTGIIMQNGWSEGVRGSFLNLKNSNGRHIILNHIIMRQGNGSADGGTAVLNTGCKLSISGTTQIAGYQNGVVTNGGMTYVDGFSDILNHSESNGGQFKVSQYS